MTAVEKYVSRRGIWFNTRNESVYPSKSERDLFATYVVACMKLRLRAKCLREYEWAEIKLEIGVNVLKVGIGYRRVASLGTLGVA